MTLGGLIDKGVVGLRVIRRRRRILVGLMCYDRMGLGVRMR